MVMNNYCLAEFVEKEKDGVIFAKISKSFNSNVVHGGYFPYEEYLGRVVNSTICPSLIEFTIEPLDKAFEYFHYGDQVTIVNFTKLAAEIEEETFSASDSSQKGCYDVNNLYIEKVLSLNDVSTIDLFKEYMKEDFFEKAHSAEYHLRNWKCNQAADYLSSLLEEKKSTL